MKIIVFSVNGKTYIGKLVTSSSQVNAVSFSNLLEANQTANLKIPASDTVTIYAPALVEFELGKESSTTGKLTWKITPLMFGALFKDGQDTNFWQFKRSEVVFSAITEKELESKFISAYKELI